MIFHPKVLFWVAIELVSDIARRATRPFRRKPKLPPIAVPETVCRCGMVYVELPAGYAVRKMGDAFDGVYFACGNCGQSIFIPKHRGDRG